MFVYLSDTDINEIIGWINNIDWGIIQSEYTGDADQGKSVRAARDFLVALLPAGTELEFAKDIEEYDKTHHRQ